jgi:hypothetical protein
MGATLGRTFTDYRTLVETCRARAAELGLSRVEIDRLAGLPAGYSGKVLGKKAVDDVGLPQKKSSKKMWPVALESMLGVLGLKILLIEDDAATARTLALREPVAANQQRCGSKHWRSPDFVPKAITGPPMLSIVSSKRTARGGKYG